MLCCFLSTKHLFIKFFLPHGIDEKICRGRKITRIIVVWCLKTFKWGGGGFETIYVQWHKKKKRGKLYLKLNWIESFTTAVVTIVILITCRVLDILQFWHNKGRVCIIFSLLLIWTVIISWKLIHVLNIGIFYVVWEAFRTDRASVLTCVNAVICMNWIPEVLF